MTTAVFPINEYEFRRWLRTLPPQVVGDAASDRRNALVRAIKEVNQQHVLIFSTTWRYRNVSPTEPDYELPNWALEFRAVEEACTEPITDALALSILDLITEHI